MVSIRSQLVGDTTMKFGGTNPKTYLTIHETGNSSSGANAAAHANLQSRRWDWATWHWTVDAKEAVQSYSENLRLWHAGDGMGHGNMSSIAIETCINSDMNRAKARDNAAQLAAQILKRNNIPINRMIQHNYWSGKNCPTIIRQEGRWAEFVGLVQKYLGQNVAPVTPAPKPTTPTANKSIQTLANEVQAGKHGNGADRQRSLGSMYAAVQAEVNRRIYGNTNTVVQTNIEALAAAVLRGEYGNGDERRRRLGNNYAAVQALVNKKLNTTPAPAGPSVDSLARAVIRGDYGNGAERQRRLGAQFAVVQNRVNQILGIR